MTKIFHFKSKKQKAEEWMKDIFAELDECASIAVIMKQTDGNVITGYLNADMFEKLNLKNHLEFDILDQFMKGNIENYIEIIEG